MGSARRWASPSSGHPQPRPAAAGQLAVELGPIAGIGGVEHGRDEAVVVGAPDRQPDVGQVGVDVQHAVAMAVVPGHRRGDALAHERDDELANGIVLARVVGHDDLGDADRASRPRLGHGRARRPERDARGRAEGEPVVGGMVERERDLGDVDVRAAERPADDRVARLRDRRATLDGRREAEPEEPVVTVVVMERRRQLDAVDAGPQADLLLAARRLERPVQPDPLADRRDLDRDLGLEVDGRREPAVRRQVPRTFGEERMVRVLAIRAQLVGDLARPDQLLAAALVDEAGDPAAARRIDRQREGLVLDGQRVDRPPAGIVERGRAGQRMERPVADGGHVAGEEGDGRPGRPARLARIGQFDQERDALAGIVDQVEPTGAVVGQVDLDPRDVRSATTTAR